MLHNRLKNKGKYCLTEDVRGQGVLQINAAVMIEVPWDVWGSPVGLLPGASRMGGEVHSGSCTLCMGLSWV